MAAIGHRRDKGFQTIAPKDSVYARRVNGCSHGRNPSVGAARHCEERSDAAISLGRLLRFARNDWLSLWGDCFASLAMTSCRSGLMAAIGLPSNRAGGRRFYPTV
jgi:hypothetical protein